MFELNFFYFKFLDFGLSNYTKSEVFYKEKWILGAHQTSVLTVEPVVFTANTAYFSFVFFTASWLEDIVSYDAASQA